MPDTNPTAGVTDFESAVEHLMVEDKPEATTEAETADEPEREEPEGEALEGEDVEAEDDTEAEEEDSGDEEDEASEDAGEEDEEEEPVYTVKVDGEEIEVPLSELLAGYQKDADYRRKTAALAEERRQIEAAVQQKVAEVEQLRNALVAELSKVAATGEPEPDWAALAQELDPWEYQQRRAAWEAKVKERAEAQQKLAAIQMEERQRQIMENARKLVEEVPEWRDPQKLAADREELLHVAREYGFTDEEFYSAVDYRPFLLLRDVARLRKLEKAAQKPLSGKKRPKKGERRIPAGAKPDRKEVERRKSQELRERLKKRGSVDDAVEYLLGG